MKKLAGRIADYYKNNPELEAEYSRLRKIRMFFQDPEALLKLQNEFDEKTESVSKILLLFFSHPEKLDFLARHKVLWLFVYYIVEFLVKDQSSEFFQHYKIYIVEWALLEKLIFLKTHISLSKRVNVFLPKSLSLANIEGNRFWENISDNEKMDWTKKCYQELDNLKIEQKTHN
ncbi:hypothetical protein BY996DRAFT_7407059, partial [Phakopsora pachyrhizi]